MQRDGRRGGRERCFIFFFLSATAGADRAVRGERPELETPLGCPQSQNNEGCWAPQRKEPESRGISDIFQLVQAHPAHQKRHLQAD